MPRRLSRVLMTLTSMAMFAAGMTVFFTSSQTAGPTPALAADTLYTIDILPLSFNPGECQVTRNGDLLRWFNKDTKARNIVLPNAPDTNAPRETGPIAPGAYSESYLFTSGGINWNYHDKDDPTITGHITVPVSPNATAACVPLPPTPTPTPTRTATPIPTATPPPQFPPACTGLMAPNDLGVRNIVKGCAVAAEISRQEDLAAGQQPESATTPQPRR